MNIFSYGRIYSKIPADKISLLRKTSGVNGLISYLLKFYFFLFGYPDIASQRRFLMASKLLRLNNGERILDAGCGNGIYLQEFGNKFFTRGVGIDARESRIREAKRINRFLGRDDVFIVSTLENVDLGTKRFDKIICLEVLEHIKDDGKVLKKLAKSLAKNGLIVLSVPIKGTALSLNQENDPNFKPKKYEHVRSGYTASDLRRLADIAGLKIIEVRKYFFLVSRRMVKIQQFLFRKKFVILNMLLSPLLLIASELDRLLDISPRGYILVLRKK